MGVVFFSCLSLQEAFGLKILANSTSKEEAKGNEKSQWLHRQSVFVEELVTGLFCSFLPEHLMCLNCKHCKQLTVIVFDFF